MDFLFKFFFQKYETLYGLLKPCQKHTLQFVKRFVFIEKKFKQKIHVIFLFIVKLDGEVWERKRD